MSAEATGAVWRSSPYKGSLRLVQLAIADVVNDAHDNEFWMSIDALAEKTLMGRTAVKTALKTLEDAGCIERIGRPKGGAVRYRWSEADPAMVGSRPSDGRNPTILSFTELKRTQPTSDAPRRVAVDHLVEVCGGDPRSATASVFKTAGTKLAEIHKAEQTRTRSKFPEDAQPFLDQISRKAKLYRTLHPTWTLSPAALAKHWHELTLQSVESEEDRILRETAEAYRAN